jgi:hypothetical protein
MVGNFKIKFMSENNIVKKENNDIQVNQPRYNEMSTEQARVIAEIQAQVILAKKDPRDYNVCYERIVKQCKRETLAKVAIYTFPRGGKNITGASIRLAEALAMSYGNIEFGVKILNQDENIVNAVAYCWDLESNVKKTDYFSVRLEKKADKVIKKITDPRDIYEHVASQGARRVRGCILAIIPGDLTDEALEECRKTTKNSGGESLEDKIKSIISAFMNYNISVEMIEKKYNKKIQNLSLDDVADLRSIYATIKDNMAKVEEFFDIKPINQDISNLLSKNNETLELPPEEVKKNADDLL